MNNERCETCKFYLPEDDGHGSCRRYPPVTVVFPQALLEQTPITDEDTGYCEAERYLRMDCTIYPMVSEKNWCGEYKPLPPKEPLPSLNMGCQLVGMLGVKEPE